MADGSAGAVLRALLELGPAPRSAIAKHAGISPATVTWQTRALLEAGLIVELPETAGASGIGRPHSPLALDTADNVAIAVHIAATHTTIAVVDIGGTLRQTTKVPHRTHAPYDILATAAAEVCIPPIHAHATGLDAKIVGVKVRDVPNYQLATAPGVALYGQADVMLVGPRAAAAARIAVLRARTRRPDHDQDDHRRRRALGVPADRPGRRAHHRTHDHRRRPSPRHRRGRGSHRGGRPGAAAADGHARGTARRGRAVPQVVGRVCR
ncbi:helix-turn-helix transcriptional regulator [Nocardia abscessus]|nr:helix-turn-helix transcriptional regulator [Nocardia abscessus]